MKQYKPRDPLFKLRMELLKLAPGLLDLIWGMDERTLKAVIKRKNGVL